MNHNKLYLSGLVILMAMMACVIPNQATQPAPITDPNSISTFIAGTAQVSALQTEQVNLAVVPSPTILPTETLVPTAVVSARGTSLETQGDESVLFTDHKAGIQVTIPSGWMAVRVEEDEYYKAFTLDVTLANPPITDRLTQIQKGNVDYFRLDAIDIRPGHIVNGIISVVSIYFEEGDTSTLEELAKAGRERVSPFVGYKFLSSEYTQTANGMRMLVTERMWGPDTDGTIYSKSVIFSLPSGSVALVFESNLGFKDTVLPDFEQVVNSLILLNS